MISDYWHHKKHGQAIMELVLVLPLLLLLILGAMDFGRMFFTKIVTTNAAREGVNYISRNPDDQTNCDITDPTQCYLETLEIITNEANSSGVTVDPSEVVITGCCTMGSPVQVQVTKEVDLIFGGILAHFGLLNDPMPLVSTARMVSQ
jgi:Flp pilus assembly protein TadG